MVDEVSEDRKGDISEFETIKKMQKVSEGSWVKGSSKHVQIRSYFKLVYDYLGQNLFDPKWEIRHGACVALRNFIKPDIHKLYISVTVDRS